MRENRFYRKVVAIFIVGLILGAMVPSGVVAEGSSSYFTAKITSVEVSLKEIVIGEKVSIDVTFESGSTGRHAVNKYAVRVVSNLEREVGEQSYKCMHRPPEICNLNFEFSPSTIGIHDIKIILYQYHNMNAYDINDPKDEKEVCVKVWDHPLIIKGYPEDHTVRGKLYSGAKETSTTLNDLVVLANIVNGIIVDDIDCSISDFSEQSLSNRRVILIGGPKVNGWTDYVNNIPSMSSTLHFYADSYGWVIGDGTGQICYIEKATGVIEKVPGKNIFIVAGLGPKGTENALERLLTMRLVDFNNPFQICREIVSTESGNWYDTNRGKKYFGEMQKRHYEAVYYDIYTSSDYILTVLYLEPPDRRLSLPTKYPDVLKVKLTLLDKTVSPYKFTDSFADAYKQYNEYFLEVNKDSIANWFENIIEGEDCKGMIDELIDWSKEESDIEKVKWEILKGQGISIFGGVPFWVVTSVSTN